MDFFTQFLMYLGARSVIKEIERNQAEQQRILAEQQRLERARIAEKMRLQSSRSSKFKVWFTVYSLRFIIHAHRVSLR